MTMRNSSKDVEDVIEEYLRKKKTAGNIDEFISACQNFRVIILDAKNKGKLITSKDIFNNTKSSNTLKAPSSLHYRQDEDKGPHNLKGNGAYPDKNTHNMHILSLDNDNSVVEIKQNQPSSIESNENPPTLNELKSSSDDIMNIIAKLKLARLITPSVDKYIQTDEFQRNVDLFDKGVLQEFEKCNATTSRKQNDTKLETRRIIDNGISELKVISSDDDSNTSTVIEKPTKLLVNASDDKTHNLLKNDTIVEETETDLYTDKYSQEKENMYHLKHIPKDVKTLPFKSEFDSDTVKPQTSKYIDKPKIDPELTDQNQTDIVKENSTVSIVHADVHNNNGINSKDSSSLYERQVQEVIKTKRLYNKDGTINEVTETVIITRHRRDPIATNLYDDDDLKIHPVMSDEEAFDQFEKDDVNFFTAPRHNMQGFIEGKEKKVKKGKCSNKFKVARRAESYIKQCLSCSDIEKLEDLENAEETSKNSTEDKETKRT